MQSLCHYTGNNFQVILADPPWHFKVRSPRGEGKSAVRYYPVMSLSDIKALPVPELAAPDAVLFLWAIWPMMPQALEVMAAWGFTFKTVGFTWAKQTKHGRWHIGTGYWTRANGEVCLLGTRGRPRRISRSVRQLVVAKTGAHSAKPPEVRERIVELMGDVPRIELFARERADGWQAWGLDCPE